MKIQRPFDLDRSYVDRIRDLMPRGWAVESSRETLIRGDQRGRADAAARIIAPDGSGVDVWVEEKQQLAGGIDQLAMLRASLPQNAAILLVTPYVSPRQRAALREMSVNYLDFTGNVEIAIERPGLYVKTQGAATNPFRKARPVTSLSSPTSGSIVRAVLESPTPIALGPLAESARTSRSQVTKVLELLTDESLIERAPRGPVTYVDRPRLLKRWIADYDIEKRVSFRRYIQPRGIQSALKDLATTDMKYAVTGSFAAGAYAPYAAPQLAVVYCERPAQLADELGLRETTIGTNVWLARPWSPAAYDRGTTYENVNVCSPVQVAADLWNLPGRSRDEAEYLIDWMNANDWIW